VRLQDAKVAQQSFSAIGGYLAFPEDMTFVGPETSEALRAARVSSNYLDILGVAPLLGRSFLEEEEVAGGPFVAMLSSRLWERHFGSRPSLSGQTAVLDGRAYTIVGVLPPDFAFPFPEIDVWTTRPYEPAYLELGSGPRVALLEGIARLKRGVTVAQAQAEFDILTDAYREAYPEVGEYGAGRMRATALNDRVKGDFQTMLWTLFGAVGLVLLIACANAASLLMARAASRSREFAVRTAVGAGNARLTRQLLTESVSLAVVAGGCGVAGAVLATQVISSTSLIELPRISEAETDLLVLGFVVLLSLATGVVFGLFPALQTRGKGIASQLRQCGHLPRAAEQGIPGFGLRNLLVVFQVALSVILLVGAGLLIRTLFELSAVDLGFQPNGLLTARVPLPTARYDTAEKRANFLREAAAAITATPEVDSATFARSLPTTVNALNTNMGIPDNPIPSARLQTVTPDYFEVLGIRLIRGRSLRVTDDQPDAAGVAIVNERFARMVWPDYSSTSVGPVGYDRLNIPLVLRASVLCTRL
jgi:predicted permease